MNEQNKETFSFTYSASKQEEIKKIRDKYIEPEKDDAATMLRKLDAKVYKKAASVSLSIGIPGALILGSGMSLTMTDIGEKIGLQSNTAMLIGVLVGVVGIAAVSLAYPVYNKTLKKERKKNAPEIIRLSDELIK